MTLARAFYLAFFFLVQIRVFESFSGGVTTSGSRGAKVLSYWLLWCLICLFHTSEMSWLEWRCMKATPIICFGFWIILLRFWTKGTLKKDIMSGSFFPDNGHAYKSFMYVFVLIAFMQFILMEVCKETLFFLIEL